MKPFISFRPYTGGSAAVLLMFVPQIPGWIACATLLVAGLSGCLLGGVRRNALSPPKGRDRYFDAS